MPLGEQQPEAHSLEGLGLNSQYLQLTSPVNLVEREVRHNESLWIGVWCASSQ